jgi:hypothetical protein
MTPGLILKWCEWPRVDSSYECPLLTQSAHSASAVQPVELLGLLAKLLGIPVFAGRRVSALLRHTGAVKNSGRLADVRLWHKAGIMVRLYWTSVQSGSRRFRRTPMGNP